MVDGITTEKYLWLNKTTLAAVYDKDDNLVQRFEYGIGNTPASFTQDGNKYYITSDHLGTPRTISDDSGNILKAIEYDSFGNVIADTNPTLEIPFGFAGGLHDKGTNLIRFGYRDFDPKTGRWTARDPIGFAGGGTNLYGYVASDPINFVDPNGLFSLTQGLTVIGLVSVIKGIYEHNQNQGELKSMRESIQNGYSVRLACATSSSCPIPYNELPSYLETLDRVEQRYNEKLGLTAFELAESLSGKKSKSLQLPKDLPSCD